MKFYRIVFCTKHGLKQFRTWFFIDVTASNKKEALNIAQDLWYANNKKHMFALSVNILKTCVLAEYFALCNKYDVKTPF